jgi:transposase-like protein
MSYGERQSGRHHCASEREFGIRFAMWCHSLGDIPSADRIRVHWRMSRATAYRWRRAWCDAIGIDPPRVKRRSTPTQAEINRARKTQAGLVNASRANEACRGCEFYRPPRSALHGWWGWCRRHGFHARPGNTCKQHAPRE